MNLKLALKEVEAEPWLEKTHEEPICRAYVHVGTFAGVVLSPNKNRRTSNNKSTEKTWQMSR